MEGLGKIINILRASLAVIEKIAVIEKMRTEKCEFSPELAFFSSSEHVADQHLILPTEKVKIQILPGDHSYD
jgi:hypothetical protein